MATSKVEFCGLPPRAITIAKLRKHNEKIMENTVNKFCFIIGYSSLIILPIKDKLRVFEIS